MEDLVVGEEDRFDSEEHLNRTEFNENFDNSKSDLSQCKEQPCNNRGQFPVLRSDQLHSDDNSYHENSRMRESSSSTSNCVEPPERSDCDEVCTENLDEDGQEEHFLSADSVPENSECHGSSHLTDVVGCLDCGLDP